MKRSSVIILCLLVACSLKKNVTELYVDRVSLSTAAPTIVQNEKVERSQQLCSIVIQALDSAYYEALDIEEWTMDTLNYGINHLDPHGALATVNKNSADEDSLHYRYGFEYANKNGEVQIIGVQPHSPAWRAGIMLGDQIIKINSTILDGTPLSTISDLLDISPITLVLKRLDKRVTKTLTRELLRDPPEIESALIEGIFGYIYMANFELGMSDKLGELLKRFYGMRGLIIDVRSNVGGFLITALDSAGYFLKPDVEMLWVRSRDGSEASFPNKVKPALPFNIPIVILTNGYTASGSEVFTQILQERGRAIVVGEKTIGYGTILETKYIFQGGVKLAIPHTIYLGPSGHSINRLGVIPDLTVTETNSAHRYVAGADDAILYKAISYLMSRSNDPTLSRR